MNTEDAINNLQKLINAALKGGIFSDTKSVLVIQNSLDKLVQQINDLSKNGEDKKKEYSDGVYD